MHRRPHHHLLRIIEPHLDAVLWHQAIAQAFDQQVVVATATLFRMPQSQALNFAIRNRPYTNVLRQNIQPKPRTVSSASQYRFAHHDTQGTGRKSVSSQRQILTTQDKFSFVTSSRTHAFRRHLSSHTNYRPQAPFLDSHIYRDPSLPARLARFIKIRYLSTARKKKLKDTLKWQLRFHAYFWPMAALLFTVLIGVTQIRTEHEHPTPREWSLWARWEGRNSKDMLDRARRRGWLHDEGWAATAEYLQKLIARLEDPQRDGKGTKVQDADGSGKILVDGVGRIGLDISDKSLSWKQGYWEAMMGVAKVAEHMDGLCKRKGVKLTKSKFYKWENIPGPQNPRPIPAAWDPDGAHLNVPVWDQVEAALDDPETYYLRILTTKGFSNRQRLDAALACADWYDFKGLKDSAANMYDWGLDIAAGGLPQGHNNVVDMQTGIINAGKETLVTENLLKATTALGVWHARNGEVKEALPIFLSLLKARKQLPAAPAWLSDMKPKQKPMTQAERDAQTQTGIMMGWAENLIDFFRENEPIGLNGSGDEQPFHTLKEACEEVGLMTYIGEILFATSEQEREKGLSWTRDSVEAAEAVLWFMDESGNEEDTIGRQRCRECLETGLSNWQQMTKRMSALAKKQQQEAQQSKGWLGLGIGQGSAIDKATAQVQRWDDEQVQVELRRQKTASLINPLKSTVNPFAMNSTVE